jgi:hypothetical protein
MAGFVLFYVLETMGPGPDPAHSAGTQTSVHAAGKPWRPWVHIGGFALYAWLLTFAMVWTGKGLLALGLFAVAMGLHIVPIVCNLHTHYPAVYHRRGAWLLTLASLAGWASALTLHIPTPIVFDLVAFVAGGVIVNAAIAELPTHGEGRIGFFLTGTVVYTAILLALFRFE